jgi:uncharacterized membrane protein YgaE (UPF0421/DUF939 family)
MPERTPSEVWEDTTERVGEAWGTTTERAGELAVQAALASRVTFAQRMQAARRALPAVVQTAIGAAVAWFIATEVVGHQGAFFAPVSATIALGLTYGQRTRRAVELAAGVAVGIGVGDLIVMGLGTGAWQIGLVVALAMLAAVALGGGQLVVRQAASSAVLVATIAVPTTFTFTRFFDALIGGAVAVFINLVVAPLDPVRLVRRDAEPLLDELAKALDELAVALQERDHEAITDVLIRLRTVDGAVRRLASSVEVGEETARWAPLRRRHRPEVARFTAAARQLDNATRDVRVLARGVLRAIDLEAHVPQEAILGLHELATAVRALRDELLHPERTHDGAAREAALQAAGHTTIALDHTNNLSISVIVGQVRATAADLLRGMGMSDDDARVAVRRAAADIQAQELADERTAAAAREAGEDPLGSGPSGG